MTTPRTYSRYPCPHCHGLIESNDVPPHKGVFQHKCGGYYLIAHVDPETRDMKVSKLDTKMVQDKMKEEGML